MFEVEWKSLMYRRVKERTLVFQSLLVESDTSVFFQIVNDSFNQVCSFFDHY